MNTMAENYISPEAFEELKAKLAYLKGVKRKELSKTVGEARDGGDLKENSGYHEAKKDQGLNESRIRDLEEKLSSAIVFDNKNQPKDRVGMGSKVRIKDVETGKEVEYTIVSEIEADIFEDKISNQSPLGGALFGSKVGEVVEVEAPRGMVKYKILKIS